jgi:uncharacterized RDD family membrane protein YckC
MFNPLFPFGRRKKETGLRYASMSSRFFAMSLDMLLLIAIFTLPVSHLAGLIFTAATPEIQMHVLQTALAGLLYEDATLGDAFTELRKHQVLFKLMFEQITQLLLGAILIIWFWNRYHTTPALALMGMEIVDAETGEPPRLKQYILRYLGVVLCMIPFGMGMLTMLFNPQRKALQDITANTAVLKKRPWIGAKDYPLPEEGDEA